MFYFLFFVYWNIFILFIQNIITKGYGIFIDKFQQQTDIDDQNKQTFLKNLAYSEAVFDFCTILLFSCLNSFGLLHIISKIFEDYVIIQSGILIPFWLLITGGLIRTCYKKFPWIHFNFINGHELEPYWIFIPILCSALYILYDYKLTIMIIAIIIGIFIWLDSEIRFKNLKSNAKKKIIANKNVVKIMLVYTYIIVLGGLAFLITYFLYLNKIDFVYICFSANTGAFISMYISIKTLNKFLWFIEKYLLN